MVRPRSRLLARPVAAVVAAAVCAAQACSLLNPLEGYSGGPAQDAARETTAAPPDTGIEPLPDVVTRDAPGGCTPARPPARPASGTGGTTTIVAAISSFEAGDAKDPSLPTTQGYDLDNSCTCPGPRSCKPTSGTGACDYPNGVDNSAGGYFLSLLNVLGSLNSETARIRKGQDGLLFRVQGYNDQPDDDEVELAVFNSFGLEGVRDAGADAGIAPRLDGTDRWTVAAESLLGGAPYLPIIVDLHAYVRGGVLVSSIAGAVRVGPYPLPFVGGTLSGRLVKSGPSYGIEDGVVSGRFNAQKLLTSMESVHNPLNPSRYLCGDDLLYLNLRDSLCANLDLVTDTTQDGREAPCDAASFSVRFNAAPAVLGEVVDGGPPKRPCGESWVGTCP